MTKYTIYIPKYISNDVGEPCVRADTIVDSIVEEIVNECGGATIYDGSGWYKCGNKIINDPVKVCVVVCAGPFNYDRVRASIQLQLNQRSVFITKESCDVI
jgi:hypothetical protein